MISDKVTNFIGAEELADYIAACHKERIEEHLSQQGIRGKSAPHFGGLWERMVRNCKKTMYPVLGNWSISEDVIPTTMCFVEQTMNARPLKPIGSDLNDLEAVTPNHFLFGNRIVWLPFLPGTEEFVDNRKLIRQKQGYADLIWVRFC